MKTTSKVFLCGVAAVAAMQAAAASYVELKLITVSYTSLNSYITFALQNAIVSTIYTSSLAENYS